MSKPRNVGGSLLSSCARILKPMVHRAHVFQVVPDESADTHHLQFDGATIASHPNGYSCHNLAERMILGDAGRAQEQADYIIACGGSADWKAILAAMGVCL